MAIRFRNAIPGARTFRAPYSTGLMSRPTVPQARGARWTSTPNRKIARMPGLMNPWNSWMKVKMPPNFGLSSRGAISMAMNTKTTTQIRPTVTSSNWVGSRLTLR